MEYLTKNEFFAKYASETEKRNIKTACVLTYLSVAIMLFIAFEMHSLYIALSSLPLLALGLGVHIAKSRVCSVLLLIYSCVDTVLLSIHMQRPWGWWVIIAGVLAVISTFLFDKKYRAFVEEGAAAQLAMESAPAEAAVPPKKHAQLLFTLLPFCGMFAGIGIIFLSIHPTFLNLLIGNAESSKALLQAYGWWYAAVIGGVVIAILLTLAGIVVAAVKGIHSFQSVKLMLVCLAFPTLLGGAMVLTEDVPQLLFHAWEDVAQIDNDQLQEMTVWLSPQTRSERFPGPYTEGQPEPLTRYTGIGEDTENEWVEFYLPNCFDASLDPDALFAENESNGWNTGYDQQYRVRFTEHFHLVVSIEPVA